MARPGRRHRAAPSLILAGAALGAWSRSPFEAALVFAEPASLLQRGARHPTEALARGNRRLPFADPATARFRRTPGRQPSVGLKVETFDAEQNFGPAVDVYSTLFIIVVLMFLALLIVPFVTYFNKDMDLETEGEEDDDDIDEDDEYMERLETVEDFKKSLPEEGSSRAKAKISPGDSAKK
eukprot:CAMPEP_0170610838 /NCGR_PEP_ID=MMETSP0224-20130122/22874_1 /TAXON_ID=285029 /ORGANISM="Togula jolla, Strain CCCM 725" /LENGTH=180 /DNA_ID=CAMNT_0010936243 /DNA_START=25 /DNA_END=567 /DNA_ORIENTATION=+